MAKEPKRARDHQILVAFLAGRTVEQLAQDYEITNSRIRDILKDERGRCNYSPEPFYRDIRLRQLLK
jgi:Mor family transcriptional regulator